MIKHVPWARGVILFFVLSGYLISNILFELKEKTEGGETTMTKALRTFYIRRFLRIFPAYYFLIFLLYYLDHGRAREIFPWLVTFTTNILECRSTETIGDFNHLWSLAVEEQFYLLWPFLVFLVKREYLLRMILIFMAGSILCRMVSYSFFDNWMVGSFFTFNLFFPLCLGALMAYAARYHEKLNKLFSSYGLMWAFILFYVAFYCFNHYVHKISFLSVVFDEYLFSVASAFVIYRASRNKFRYLAGFILSHEAVVYAGKISYGLYLYHLFIVALYWKYLAPRFQIDIYNIHTIWVFYFIVLFFVASFSYYLIEKPFNSLKKYFSY
jgi:peptidoglycan/LPS O-acetylase OafA/YrhL